MVSRVARTPFAEWWWTVDRTLLVALVVLVVFGLVLNMAGSPPVAERLGLSTFHFVHRQIVYLVPAAAVLLLVSFFSPRNVRRLALLVFLAALALTWATLWFAPEVKGARRWLTLVGVTVQPSEFLKPAFVVLAAWLMSETARRPDMPGATLSILLLPLTVAPLLLQPDVGQTMLVLFVWCGLIFIAGLHLFWVLGLVGLAGATAGAAYLLLSHVRGRIDRFLDPSTGDSFNADTAMESFVQGSWFGKGPGEGTVKRILPEAHTDYIFSVTGEEFGVLACLALAWLFAFIVLRSLVLARRSQDPFARLAAAGLALLFGIQATINMAVNLHLIPAKGMTLPFVSYGGSSLVSLALGMGFLLSLTRRRPLAEQAGMERSRLASDAEEFDEAEGWPAEDGWRRGAEAR